MKRGQDHMEMEDEMGNPKRAKASSAYQTEFPSKMVYSLPKKGQEGLRKISTRLNPTGNRKYEQAYDSSGGEKFTFQFPDTANRYIDFSNLKLRFNLRVTGANGTTSLNYVTNNTIGAHGMISETVFTTGSGEILENYSNYDLRVARNMKFMNNNIELNQKMVQTEGICEGKHYPAATSLSPGILLAEQSMKDVNVMLGQNLISGYSPSRTFKLPFRGSDLCMQVDRYIPLTVFDGLNLEVTLKEPSNWIHPDRSDTAWTSFTGARVFIDNVFLEIEYWELPVEDDRRLMQALKQGRVIPINYVSSRILRGTETLQNQTETETTIPLNETLSSVRSLHILFRDARAVAEAKCSNTYFVEPGRIAPYANRNTAGTSPATFQSFQMEIGGENRPEFPITNRTELLQTLHDVANQEGKLVVLDGTTRILHVSDYDVDGEFTGSVPSDLTTMMADAATKDHIYYAQRGGGFCLAFPFRTYPASKNVMNGFRLKNNASIHYTFDHQANATTNYQRFIFLNHDTVLEIGHDRKTLVKT